MAAKSSEIHDKLIKDALTHLSADEAAPATSADERGRKAIEKLCRRTDAATLDAAIALSKSADNARKRLGADILGRLGMSSADLAGVFREERFQALRELIETEMTAAADTGVLGAVCSAFSQLEDPRAVPLVLPLIGHSSVDLRMFVALVLSDHEDEAAIAGLIRLSADPHETVRDCATGGLALIDADSAAIRAALHARLTDSSAEARGQAIHALVEREDRAVLPFLAQELAGPRPHTFLEDALELADPSLCPALVQAGKTISSTRGDREAETRYWKNSWREAMAACGCRSKEA